MWPWEEHCASPPPPSAGGSVVGVTPWVSEMIRIRVRTVGFEEEEEEDEVPVVVVVVLVGSGPDGAGAVEGGGGLAAGVAGFESMTGGVVGSRGERDSDDDDTGNGRHKQDRLGLFLLARRGGGLVGSDAGWAPCRDVEVIDAEARQNGSLT